MRTLWAAAAVAVLLASLVLTGPAALAAAPSDADTARGSIWIQRNDPDPATYTIINADGTLLSVGPYLGYGVGVWEPTGERSMSSTLVFADVDMDRSTTAPGVATFRSEITLDETGESASALSTWTLEPVDGPAPTSDSATSVTLNEMTRQWLAPMPPEAIASTPPDPGWQPVLSAVAGGGGRVEFEPYDPPNHNVSHPDGTGFSFNAWVGPGVGQRWPIDDTSGIGTTWFTEWDPDRPPLVGEGEDYADGTRYRVRYWESGVANTGTGTYMRLTTPDGTPLTPPDPALWPELGSAWIERNGDQAPSLWIVWADGTVLHIDPELGTGLGLWQPTAEGTATVAIRYNASYPNRRYRTMPGTADLKGEMTIDEGEATLTTTYDVEYSSYREAGEPTGTMVADRIEVEPAAP